MHNNTEENNHTCLAHWAQSVYIITVTDVTVHNSVLPVTILGPKLGVVTTGM